MAPVTLDLSKEVLPSNRDRDLVNGVHILLNDSQKDEVVMTKWISTDPQHADWRPEGFWDEEVTVDVGGRGKTKRIQVEGADGELRSLGVDDGTIVKLRATMTSIVGMVPGLPPMSQEAAEDYEDAQGMNVPRFQQWDFRIREVLKTDGPESRRQLTRGEDQKRINAQTEMYDAFTKMFQMGMAGKEGELSPNINEVVAEGLRRAEEQK